MMATMHGEIVAFGNYENWVHAVGAQVVVTKDGRAVAAGLVDREDKFEIELPPGISGELEVTVATQGAAPALVDVDDEDLMVTIIYSPGGAYY